MFKWDMKIAVLSIIIPILIAIFGTMIVTVLDKIIPESTSTSPATNSINNIILEDQK